MKTVPITRSLLVTIHEIIHDKENYLPGEKVILQNGLEEELYIRVNGCRAIDLNEYSFMEQNVNTNSLYAQEVKNFNSKITWGVRANGTWGLIHQLASGEYLHISDGERDRVNDID